MSTWFMGIFITVICGVSVARSIIVAYHMAENRAQRQILLFIMYEGVNQGSNRWRVVFHILSLRFMFVHNIFTYKLFFLFAHDSKLLTTHFTFYEVDFNQKCFVKYIFKIVYITMKCSQYFFTWEYIIEYYNYWHRWKKYSSNILYK